MGLLDNLCHAGGFLMLSGQGFHTGDKDKPAGFSKSLNKSLSQKKCLIAQI